MRNDTTDWTLLERYVAGDCSPEERRGIVEWVAAAPQERQSLVESLRTITGVSQKIPAPIPDSPQAWQHLDARITRAGFAPRTLRRHTWAIVAAAMAVVMVVGGDLGVRVWHRAVPQAFREFVVPAGGRAAVTLRDGTRLTLGPETRLRVPADFGQSTRTVTLEGEALFAVVHDVAHPFVVMTSSSVIRDVGTVFDVRAYAGDRTVRVAVAEGEVTVGAAFLRPGVRTAETPLVAHDAADITDQGITVTHDADIAASIAWLQGGLAFRDVPLAQVLRDVARRFDLRITVSDSTLNSQLVTATFGNESADEILDEVTHAVGARYAHVGSQIIVHRRANRSLHDDTHTQHPILRTAQAESLQPE